MLNYLLYFTCVLIIVHMSKSEDNKPGFACQNSMGHFVGNGEHFTPLGSDPCTQCTCLNGRRERCRSLLCSPMKKCELQKPSPDKCCEFICLDSPNTNITIGVNDGNPELNATNLGLRLVASTVTSLLILALLLFMIHRLRQRRLLLMMRRINNDRANNNNSVQRCFIDEDIRVGYLVGRDQVDFYNYGDPPPPYASWKPQDVFVPPGEPPPPYEATVVSSIPSYDSLPQTNFNQHFPVNTYRLSCPQFHTFQRNCAPNFSAARTCESAVQSQPSFSDHSVRESQVIFADMQYSEITAENSSNRNSAVYQPNFQLNGTNCSQGDGSCRSSQINALHSTRQGCMLWENSGSDSSSSSQSICERTISPSSSECSSLNDFLPASDNCNRLSKLHTLPMYQPNVFSNKPSCRSKSLNKSLGLKKKLNFKKRKSHLDSSSSEVVTRRLQELPKTHGRECGDREILQDRNPVPQDSKIRCVDSGQQNIFLNSNSSADRVAANRLSQDSDELCDNHSGAHFIWNNADLSNTRRKKPLEKLKTSSSVASSQNISSENHNFSVDKRNSRNDENNKNSHKSTVNSFGHSSNVCLSLDCEDKSNQINSPVQKFK